MPQEVSIVSANHVLEAEIIELDTDWFKKEDQAAENFRSPMARRLLQTGQTIADHCFPTGNCDLSSLMNGYGGFVLQGEAADDLSGYWMRQAGDINGDGLDDLIVGASGAKGLSGSASHAGRSYVVFGSNNSSAWGNGKLDLSSLMNGQRGFLLWGEAADDSSGISVSGAGDINGDGLDDLIVGASGAQGVSGSASHAGRSYVVFGSNNSSAWGNGKLGLSSLMNGQRGFLLWGEAADDSSGISVSGAGDINGDGLDDLIVGASGAKGVSGSASHAGRSYVVFGSNNSSAWGNGKLGLSSLMNGQRGFLLWGEAADDFSGISVSGAGDINGDGLDDLIVGASGAQGVSGSASHAGRSYVVFGSNNSSAWGNGKLGLSSLMNGQRGFLLWGEAADDFSGISVSGAGDINGDGLDDLIVGASGAQGVSGSASHAGRSYVVFGSNNSSAWGNGKLGLSSLMNGQRGFLLWGEAADDSSGISVSGAGDINGDGLDDLIVGASGAKGVSGSASHAGRSYVVFGSNNSSAWGNGKLGLSSLMNGQRGFLLRGEAADDNSGISVSQAGDINDDGAADLLVGAYLADPAGRGSAGKSYVVFGVNHPPLLLNNTLTLRHAETVTLISASLSSTDDRTPSSLLLYHLTNIQHGQFAFTINPNAGITQFFQSNITDGLVQFTHDGNSQAPSYLVTVSDGFKMTEPAAATVIFYRQPSLNLSGYALLEGGSQTLSSSQIQIIDDYSNTQVLLRVNQVTHGQFILTPPGTPNITQFTRAQLAASQVSFQHDGGELDASYELSLQDPYYSLPAVLTHITRLPVNDAPVLARNFLSIAQGETMTLNSTHLWAFDPDNSDDQLIFYVSDLQRGVFFETAPFNPIYSFSQADVNLGKIHFIHDNSMLLPYYQMTVSDGSLSSLSQPAVVTFNGVNRPPVLLSASFAIAEGQSIILSASQFSASDIDTPTEQLVFEVSYLQHGWFERWNFPGVAVMQFSLPDVQQNMIRFIHDGSEQPPAMNVVVTDGVSTTTPRAVVINYTPINNAPVLENNLLTLSEGETVTLREEFLSATDRDSLLSSLAYTVSQVQRGRFELTSRPGISINSFSQQAVTGGLVSFVHDGGELAPSYAVSVDDGLISSLPKAAQINFTNINDAPMITLNRLSLNEGESAVLSNAQLTVVDVDTPISELVMTASNIQHGYFERAFNPGIALSSFSGQDLQFGFIRFSHDGGEFEPSYDIVASDGLLSTAPSNAVITFVPVNDPPVLAKNQLTLTEGETVSLSGAHLLGSDPDSPVDDLLFTVTDVQHGQFVMDGQTRVSSFYQKNITDGGISFIHDGSEQAPSYLTMVSDGQLTTIPQFAAIDFTAVNDAPIVETNTLTITQGQAVVLNRQSLSASDEETADKELIFTVGDIAHGHFEYVTTGAEITVFSQEKIVGADIRFVHDGSRHAPSYTVSVSDGELTTLASTPVIQFAEDRVKYAPSDDGVQRAITAGIISGSIGFMFLVARLIISYKVNQRLQTTLMKGQMQSDTQEERSEFYKNVIHPIAEKIFARIKTTGLLGYRSEQATHAYLDAIIHLVTRLNELGLDLEMKGQSADKSLHLFNEIAKQVRQVLVAERGYCSMAYYRSFFKAEVTPQQFADHIETIAQQISTAYSRKNQLNHEKVELIEIPEMKSEIEPGYSPRLMAPRQRSSSTDERFTQIDAQFKNITDHLKNITEHLGLGAASMSSS